MQGAKDPFNKGQVIIKKCAVKTGDDAPWRRNCLMCETLGSTLAMHENRTVSEVTLKSTFNLYDFLFKQTDSLIIITVCMVCLCERVHLCNSVRVELGTTFRSQLSPSILVWVPN